MKLVVYEKGYMMKTDVKRIVIWIVDTVEEDGIDLAKSEVWVCCFLFRLISCVGCLLDRLVIVELYRFLFVRLWLVTFGHV